jgi:hypothetical protein
MAKNLMKTIIVMFLRVPIGSSLLPEFDCCQQPQERSNCRKVNDSAELRSKIFSLKLNRDFNAVRFHTSRCVTGPLCISTHMYVDNVKRCEDVD